MSSPFDMFGGGFDFTCGISRRLGRLGLWSLSEPRYVADRYSPVLRLIIADDSDNPFDVGTGFVFADKPGEVQFSGPDGFVTYIAESSWLGGPYNAVVITPAPGVTVNFDAGGGPKFKTPWSFVSLYKTDANAWKVTGDVQP